MHYKPMESTPALKLALAHAKLNNRLLGDSEVLITQGQDYSPCAAGQPQRSGTTVCEPGVVASLATTGDINKDVQACASRVPDSTVGGGAWWSLKVQVARVSHPM